MAGDVTQMGDIGRVGAGLANRQGIAWRCEWDVQKYAAGAEDVRAGRYVSSTNPVERLGQPLKPYESVERVGNVLLRGGGDILWLGIKGGLTATTGAKNTFFDNNNAVIVVGSSGAAAVATQTDLSASTDAHRECAPMEATYPIHTTGTGSTANLDITFRGVFTTAMANFDWEEWGIGNTTKSTAPYAGRLLNRKAEALGTKTAAATWTFTCKLSLS